MAEKVKKLLNATPKSDGSVTVLLYGEVGNWGDIKSDLIVTELLELERLYNKIEVHINSNGGDVFSGIAIHNALKASKADISIYIDGVAASIAGVIALCGKPLYMSQYARLMIHKVSGGAYGSAKELRETADLIESLEASLAEIIASRSTLSKEEVIARYFDDGADHWLTAKEALELKMIDGIHDLPKVENLGDDSTTEEIYKAFNNRLEEPQNPLTTDMSLLEKIKALPAFKNATENDVVDKIAELESRATKAEAVSQAVESLTAKLAEMEEQALQTIVNTAVADGRIQEAQKEYFLALLKSDRKNAEQLLNSMPATPKGSPRNSAKDFTSPSNGGGTSDEFRNKSWDDLDQKNLLARFKEEDPEGFANAYKAKFGVDYQ